MEYLIEAIGIAGAIAVLVAYGLNSYQKLKSDSALFYWLNFTGGVLLVVYTLYKHAWASMVINIIWAIVALAAIIKAVASNRKSK